MTIQEHLSRLHALPTYAENQRQREQIVDELLKEHPDYAAVVLENEAFRNGRLDLETAIQFRRFFPSL